MTTVSDHLPVQRERDGRGLNDIYLYEYIESRAYGRWILVGSERYIPTRGPDDPEV